MVVVNHVDFETTYENMIDYLAGLIFDRPSDIVDCVGVFTRHHPLHQRFAPLCFHCSDRHMCAVHPVPFLRGMYG